MKIMIDDTYGIYSDEANIVPFEMKTRGEKSRNQGEQVESNIGYYGTIQSALRGYAKISTRQPNQEGYKELLQKLDAIEQAILKVKIPSK